MMNTSDHYNRVREFMINAEQEVLDTPTIPSEEVRRLRAKLILEEAMETVKALGFDLDGPGFGLVVSPDGPNLVEIADGCADISVVTIGTLIACGIADLPLLEMIDESNAAKFDDNCPRCGSERCASIGDSHYRTCLECDGRYRPGYRRDDGKWVKPESWETPDIAALLAKMR